MFFRHEDLLKAQKRSKKKRSFIFQDMFGSFRDPNILSDELILSLGWHERGIFFTRSFNLLVFFTFLFFFLSFYYGFFLYFIFFQWFYYSFLIHEEIEAFSEGLTENVDFQDSFSKSFVLDKDQWPSWNSFAKVYLARAHILFSIHYSIVPVMNRRLLRYNQKFQFFFLSNYINKSVNMSYFLKYLKLTFKKTFIKKKLFFYFFFNKFNRNILDFYLNKKKSNIKDIYINYKEKPLFISFLSFNYFLKDFFFFRKKFFFKIYYCFSKVQQLLAKTYLYKIKSSIIVAFQSKAIKFSFLEYNKFILNSYKIKFRALKMQQQVTFFSYKQR